MKNIVTYIITAHKINKLNVDNVVPPFKIAKSKIEGPGIFF